MAKRSNKQTTERSIYFYRVDRGTDASGKPIPFDPTERLKQINSLSFDLEGRYMVGPDGRTFCCWVDNARAPHSLRFGSIRRSEFPQIEEGGDLSPLDLPASAGLAEQIHVVFFPDGIVGSEFNFHGPRISRLADYLLTKSQPPNERLSFDHLLRQDVTEQLARLQTINLFQLKIHRSYTDIIAQANNDLGSAFRAAQRAGEAMEIEIILKPQRRSGESLSTKLLQTARQLAGTPHMRDGVRKFQVKGYDEQTKRIEEVDVLSDKLIVQKQIMLMNQKGRALDDKSAYRAIEASYRELHDELLMAAAAGR